MSKVRIYELAKQLNRPSKEILDELSNLGIEGKTHTSGIEQEIADKVLKAFSVQGPTGKPAEAVVQKSAATEPKPKDLSREAKASHHSAREEVKKTEPAAKANGPQQEKPRHIAAVIKPSETQAVAEKLPELESTEPETDEQPIDLSGGLDIPTVPGTDSEEGIELPDKFKKEVEAEKIEKFKARPGLQRAFQAIRKIEPRKGHDIRGGKKGDRGRFPYKQDAKPQLQSTMPRKKTLKLREGTTVKEFSELIGLKFSDVIKKFMELGYMPTINQPVDADAALLVAESFGIKLELASVEDDTEVETVKDDTSSLKHRAPVVTIMGHVDHGKTSLLDAIRETKVTETEAGGITQHIGAYKINLHGKDIVFLDTPGHEAFTAMRARGAKLTDIVVLVVAADDGVMPQTVEAINHAKAAGVPIVVAVNKIDKPDGNPQKVKNELSEHGIIFEDSGGHNIFVGVSAKKRIGIEPIFEMILLQAEIMELKANHDREAPAPVIEPTVYRGRRPVATLLVQ